MNKFKELCAELNRLDIPYKTTVNNAKDGHYAMLVDNTKEGSTRYMAVADCAVLL